MDMIAKRTEENSFEIFADGYKIGILSNCEVAHIFLSEDEEIEGYIVHRIEGDMSLREMLREIRAGYESFVADQRSLAEAEMRSENAWLIHAERFDPEAQADLELHDSLHPHGYC